MQSRIVKLKRFSRSLIGKGLIASVILALIGMGLPPMLKAHATSHGSGNFELGVSVDSNADWVDNITIDGFEWDSDDLYLSNNGSYFITAELHVPNDSVRQVTSIRAGGDSGAYIINMVSDEDWYGTHRKFTYTINYDATREHDHLSLNPYSEDNGGHGGDEGDDPHFGDMQAKLRITNGQNQVRLGVNGGPSDEFPPQSEVYDEQSGDLLYNEMTYRYEGEQDDENITLRVATLWHLRLTGTIYVNGQPYSVSNYIDYDDEASWLEHYDHQEVGIGLEVPKTNDNTYTVTADVTSGGRSFIGNFLWTADPGQEWEVQRDDAGRLIRDEEGNYVYRLDNEGNRIPNFNYIGHSRIQPVAVSYVLNNRVYSCNLDEDRCTIESLNEGEGGMGCVISADPNCGIPYVEYETDPEVEFDDGALVVPAGARVTMRIIPDYGYQVMNVNMSELEVDDEGVGYFTFTVPEGAAYFVADVVEMPDTVRSESDAVVGGTIELGNDQTTLDHGSARLDVNNVDLSDQEIEGFNNAADGYNIKTFLDISLFNVTCKGAETCTGADEDSWNEQVDDLNEPATITLQLGEGVDGNEIVIVHQKHDGTYEVIPTEYDASTNTITFTTTSFSNYAIASRTVNSPNTGEMTGDKPSARVSGTMVITIVVLSGVLVAETIVVSLIKRKKKEQNQ